MRWCFRVGLFRATGCSPSQSVSLRAAVKCRPLRLSVWRRSQSRYSRRQQIARWTGKARTLTASELDSRFRGSAWPGSTLSFPRFRATAASSVPEDFQSTVSTISIWCGDLHTRRSPMARLPWRVSRRLMRQRGQIRRQQPSISIWAAGSTVLQARARASSASGLAMGRQSVRQNDKWHGASPRSLSERIDARSHLTNGCVNPAALRRSGQVYTRRQI